MTKREIEDVLNNAIEFADENGNIQLKRDLANVFVEVQYNLVGSDEPTDIVNAFTAFGLYGIIKSMCEGEISANKPIVALLPNGEEIPMMCKYRMVDGVFFSELDVDEPVVLTSKIFVDIIDNNCEEKIREYFVFGDCDVKFVNGKYEKGSDYYHISRMEETNESLVFTMVLDGKINSEPVDEDELEEIDEE